MKTFYTLLLSCLLSLISYGQDWQWSVPIPVSDSVNDNRNATLSDLLIFNGFGSPLYMCWERSGDASSTALMGRCLQPMAAPFVIASLPNVHFRNPKILKYLDGDTLFSVYFETDMNGNWDIYRINYLNGGIVSPMIPVLTTSDDETSFSADGTPPYASVIWLKNGNVMAQETGYSPSELATGGCSNPLIISGDAFWLKDSLVWYSTFQSGSWSTPVSISGTPCRHLSLGNDTHPAQAGIDLVFDQKRSGYWRLMNDYPSYTPDSVSDLVPGNNLQPSYCTVFIFTKSGNAEPSDYAHIWPLTFASDQNGNMEIYGSNLSYGNFDYLNLSNFSGADTHPQLFNFFSGDHNYLFDVWESYRNGHWQLWMTTADIATGINDPGSPDGFGVKTNPNPFSETVEIEYQLSVESVISVVIINTLGKQVVSLKESDREAAGIHHLKWDGTNSGGVRVTPGVYLCSITVNGKTVQRKIILI
ncbi:MAG: T9SS type A sorting domain-containing protein [Bacteroidetes bacterium]|nr:T9SS type A sorting domain-containing protein [Bacteroidota bacterium]